MSEHKTCKRTDCRWCGADGHPFCSDFCGLRWYRQHGDDSIDEHDGCEGPGAAEIVRQGPSSYPELSRIAEICRDVRKEGTAMQAALSAADALAALEVYRQAVLKSIVVLNLARAPGPPGGRPRRISRARARG